MGSPLVDVAFLARSENRVSVLRELTASPHDRYSLQEQTGVGRVTLGRVLSDFQERGWICSVNGRYETTPVGGMVAASFADLLETMASAEKLSPIATLLPEEMSFDLRRLADATVHVPSATDPFATLRPAVEQLERAHHVRLLTNATTPETLEVLRRRTTSGELKLEAIADDELLEVLVEAPETSDMLEGMITESSASIWRSGDPVPFIIAIHDDSLVHIGIADETGGKRALVESVDDVVLEWANDFYDDYRQRAKQIDAEPIDAELFVLG